MNYSDEYGSHAPVKKSETVDIMIIYTRTS